MSPDDLNDTVKLFLSSPSRRCLVLVSADVARLDAQAGSLCERYGCSQVSVGRELSSALLTVVPAQRPQNVRRALVQTLSEQPSGGVLCTHIDLLFEPDLRVDPLMLFRRLARISPLIVCWPGGYRADVLSYAVPDHTHYRTWRNPDAVVVPLT